MRKLIFILLFCLTQTVRATAELTFTPLKPLYYVGEYIILDLQENLETSSRFEKVDLWVAVQLPSKDMLFMTPLEFDRFSPMPQPFRTGLEKTEHVHKILNFELLEGLGGDYVFYALYVEEGKNPMTDSFLTQRSNLARTSTVLSNQFPNSSTSPAPQVGEVFQDRLKDGGSAPEMVMIPAGSFQMGDIQGGGQDDELPVHWVSVNAFAMGRYEVTFAEYDRFAYATGRGKPDDEGWGRGNRPVINVSWDDATAYTAWLSTQTGKAYRLPTEAEWEYAARAGTETKYWWGNEIGSNQANCSGDYCGDSFEYTASVGSFAANPFGLYDTVGNVWEWNADSWHSNYEGAPSDGSVWEGDSNYRVLRGGSWYDVSADLRAAYRYWYYPDGRHVSGGFRVVRAAWI